MKLIKVITLGLMMMLFATATVAAEFVWTDPQGGTHSLDEYKGKPLVLHLWASWCFPCRTEMPEMAVWMNKHPEVTTLLVSLDKTASDAERFLQSISMDTPPLLTTSSQLYGLGTRGLPATVLIDEHGNILSVHSGVQRWDEDGWNNKVLALFLLKS